MLQLRPHFVQALAAHRVRRAQLLGEEAHAQLFQHPAVLLQPRIVLAFALGQQAGIALLQRLQFLQFGGIAGRVGADFVQADGDGLQVAGKVLQLRPGGCGR